MTLDKVTVVLFGTATTSPVRDFLDGLPPKIYRKAIWTLETVQLFGRASSHYFKALKNTGGLFEVRVTASRGDLRLLGFFAPGNRFVLVHGFVKKTQQTPEHEIAVALQRKSAYLKAIEGHHEAE